MSWSRSATKCRPKEWPLVFVEEFDALLVVREWPGGKITAYATSDYSDAIRGTGEDR